MVFKAFTICTPHVWLCTVSLHITLHNYTGEHGVSLYARDESVSANSDDCE